MVARIKEGLNRLERYGTFDVHPSEQRTRFPEDNVNVVFDFSGVTYVDPRFIHGINYLIEVQLKSFATLFRDIESNGRKCILLGWWTMCEKFLHELKYGIYLVIMTILRELWKTVCDLSKNTEGTTGRHEFVQRQKDELSRTNCVG
jgi:hypothetical protein